MPLAFCDSRTVDKEKDLVYSRLLYPPPGQPGHQVEGETFNVKHNENHVWYYLPDIGPQEGQFIFFSRRSPLSIYSSIPILFHSSPPQMLGQHFRRPHTSHCICTP